jgi:hypothetical protein
MAAAAMAHRVWLWLAARPAVRLAISKIKPVHSRKPVAELAAAYLRLAFGLANNPREDHVAYIDFLLKK